MVGHPNLVVQIGRAEVITGRALSERPKYCTENVDIDVREFAYSDNIAVTRHLSY